MQPLFAISIILFVTSICLLFSIDHFKPINSLKLINSPIIIAFSNIDDGGIIIVHINKFPAPVDTRILKYIK